MKIKNGFFFRLKYFHRTVTKIESTDTVAMSQPDHEEASTSTACDETVTNHSRRKSKGMS